MFIPELKQFVTVRISQRGLKIVDKLGGLLQACRRYEKTISPKLQKLIRRAA
jgi:ribosomal protein L28